MSGELVLVHGWGLNRCVWEPLLARLPDPVTAYPVDLPGYGCPSVNPYDLENLARTVLERAPRQATWVGSSLGGMVALQASLAEPERVQRLVLVGTTPRFVNDTDWPHGTDQEIFASFTADLMADYQKTLHRYLFLQAGQARHARALVRDLAARIRDCGTPSVGVLRAGLRCLQSADLRPHLQAVRCPVHIVQGRLDKITPPSAAQYLASQLPGAELSWMRSGHLPFVSHPEEFMNLLQQDLYA